MRPSIRSSLAAAPLLVLAQTSLLAQPLRGIDRLADSARILIEVGATTGSLSPILTAQRIIERGLAQAPHHALLWHYQGYAFYRMANLVSGDANRTVLLARLRAARDALRRSIAIRPLAESWMLLSAVDGRLSGLDASMASVLTAEAIQATDSGVALGATNPRVYLLSGIAALFTPAQLDGGDAAAEQIIMHAIALFMADHPAPPAPAWGRAEAYAWLGQIYQRRGRTSDALVAYRKALALEPHFGWVRDVLLPGVKAGRTGGSKNGRAVEAEKRGSGEVYR